MFCPTRDLERRNGGTLGRHQRFLLRQLELRSGPALELVSYDDENALGCRQVLASDAQLILRGENLEIGVGHGDHGRQRDDLAIVPRDRRVLFGGIEQGAIFSPDVEHIAGREAHIVLRKGCRAAGGPEVIAGGNALGSLMLALGAGCSRHRRQQRRTRYPRLGVGLHDLGDRDGDIEVLDLRGLH